MLRKLLRAALVIAALLTVTTAFAEKIFVRKDLSESAARLEEALGREFASPAGNSAAQLRRSAQEVASKDPRKAMLLLGSALRAEPDSFAAWYAFAKAANAIDGKSWQERDTLRGRSKSAAYKAYLVAGTPVQEAEALALLGSLFEGEKYYRPAINSYAASLKFNETAAIRKTYEQLVEKYGFRYLDYSVDSDAATPRVCFKFSEALQDGKVDYTPFVATTGLSNPAIFVEGNELCVEGVKHGQSYNFVLRQGIPSVLGESLRKSVDLNIDVKDRSPQVRVIGRNYVLPTTGQDGLPLMTVNTAQVDIEVYRIGDRNIVPTVRSEDFLQQLTGYSINDIALNKGVRIWTGTLDTKSDVNQDIVTTFPVVEAVGKMDPGIYVLTAVPHGGKMHASDNSDDYDEDSYRQRATQWFVVSDLGLTAFKSKNGIHVLARSLSTAQPVANAEARLLARNNDVLATRTLDTLGHTGFDPGLSRGEGGLEPGLVVVSTGSDYNFINLSQTPFDLSDRGVKGRAAAGPVDVYVFAERGVYRPLETVHITALLRDAQGHAIDKMPLTAVVRRPDGVEFRRLQIEDQGLGGRTMDIAMPADAAHGTWRVAFYADPKGFPVGSMTFLIEDYVAERLELTLGAAAATVRPGETAKVDVKARYLFGAPGSDLQISGQYSVQAASDSPFEILKGYAVGLDDERFPISNSELEEEASTDQDGAATVDFAVPDIPTIKPAEIKLSLRVSEAGGRGVERSITLPVLPATPSIGIRKKFAELAENQPATFDILTVDAAGRPLSGTSLKWTLYQVIRTYQWFNSDGRWNYEPVERKAKVGEGDALTSGAAPVAISTSVNLGTYRLEVSAPDLGETARSSLTFTAGYSGDQTANTPDLLDLTIDKASYIAGDTMQVQLSPRFDGKATIAVISDKMYDLQTVDVSKSGTLVRLPVKAEWGAGAYLVALAHRPLDTAAKRLPGRALGLTWFQVDKDKRALDVKIMAPDRTLPGRDITIPVKVSGMEQGEDAYVTLAAVDVGILNLTRYESPDPTRYFFGQKQLSGDILDLYGYLIDGMQGTRGAFRAGGDGMPALFDALPPTEEPLALFSGIVKVGPDGVANIPFTLPAFNGSGRLMATAWSSNRVGSASVDLPIRDPVVTLVTLPRFLAIGDQTRLFLQINNVDGPAGDYTVDFAIDGPIAAKDDDLHHTLKLQKDQKTTLSVPVAALGHGLARIDMKMHGPGTPGGQIESFRSYKIGIVPGTVSTSQRIVREIKPGQSVTLSSDLVDNIIPDTGAVTVAISTASEFDLPGLLKQLDRYPYGCTEQLVSRAMPLLYLNSLSAAESMAADEGIEERIRATIERILSRQSSNGAFGYWSAGSSSLWLDAFAADFLTRAREMKYAVPDRAFNLVLDRLRNYVANTTNVEDNSTALAYSAYVLARNGRQVMGDLRYLADTRLAAFKSPLARAQLAAALSLLGDRSRAQSTFDSAVQQFNAVREEARYYDYYGSRLRDGAGVIALGPEAGASRTQLQGLSRDVANMAGSRTHTSTQEKIWMVLAAQALNKDAGDISLKIDGADRTGAFYRGYRDAVLASKPVSIGNTGKAAVKAVINVLGNPISPEPAISKGYKIERTYYDLSGAKVDPSRVAQNTRLVTVLTVSEPFVQDANLMVVDRLPAGFEIDNPKLVDSTDIGALKWLNQAVAPEHTEYRDDRFLAAFERQSGQPNSFTIAYIVRAVTPGKFMHPPATAEDMYRSERFGRSAFGSVEVFEK